ncbi:PREDICTED: uncharacterized protein LOC104701237 [Camelina sativa]|uniref:Uncharacterized protein LOC104701237 n=1 Tax=Camelina sativa TaxID=90675 RepID=A0ABM0SRR6_CAMSA|nr:PREDICTED: uncharacterized protein LOC104701237 [Camelina sativa]
MEYGDEENDIEDSDEDNGVEDSDEEEHDVEDSDADNDSEYSEDDGVSETVQIVDKHNRSIGICNSPYHYLHNSFAEHLYIFEFDAYVHVISHELFIKFSIDGDELVVKECGVNYEDCEADSLNTEKRRMDDNGDSSAITDISKYTNNSETGCSKSKVTEMSLEKNVIKATHEHGEENTVHIANALISSEISVFPSVVGISGVCEAEENVNGNSSVEKKKRKKQIPTIDTERTSEVGNNGDCEANKEVCENDSAKIKRRRVSFLL